MQHPQFQVEVFGGGFDHQLHALQAAVVRAGANLVQGRELLLLRQCFLGDLPIEVFADGRDRFLQGALGDVEQGHVEAGQGAHLRNAITHGARADHANVLQLHVPVLPVKPCDTLAAATVEGVLLAVSLEPAGRLSYAETVQRHWCFLPVQVMRRATFTCGKRTRWPPTSCRQ
ncbi:hypothetical protein EMIT0P253_100131 [Pseudomonas sp. IT-P253]